MERPILLCSVVVIVRRFEILSVAGYARMLILILLHNLQELSGFWSLLPQLISHLT
jgi:hypothetical protein